VDKGDVVDEFSRLSKSFIARTRWLRMWRDAPGESAVPGYWVAVKPGG